MSGVLLANKNRSSNPIATPVDQPSPAVSAEATPQEVVTQFFKEDVGDLGFLFGHDAPSPVSTAIPTPATNAVTPAQSAAMAQGMTVAAGSAAPGDSFVPNGTEVPVNAPPSAQPLSISGAPQPNGWRFRDTLASEVGKIKARVAKYQSQTTGS